MNIPFMQFTLIEFTVIFYLFIAVNVAGLAYVIRKDNTGSGLGLFDRLLVGMLWPFAIYKGVFQRKK